MVPQRDSAQFPADFDTTPTRGQGGDGLSARSQAPRQSDCGFHTLTLGHLLDPLPRGAAQRAKVAEVLAL